MKLTETIKSTPLVPDRSIRPVQARCLTSAGPGKNVPLFATVMAREDRVQSGRVRVMFDAAEMVQTPLNAIGVTVYCHFVPYLAFERFEGSLDRMNRSYKGEPDKTGGDLVPFVHQLAFDRAAPFWKTLGVHAPQGAMVNSQYLEAYNVLWNYRSQARSTKLTPRALYDTTLAPAFWRNPGMSYIVPDFDQAAMDGEIELNVVAAELPVKGIGHRTGQLPPSTNQSAVETGGETVTYAHTRDFGNNGGHVMLEMDASGVPKIVAELQSQGITLSLANIHLAEKTKAFALERKKFQGLDDDFIIDLLMEGIRVPDAQLAQPILLDRKTTVFGYNKRFATDSANLDKHVTNGETVVDLRFRTPPMNTGGVIIVTAEIVPEQLFERTEDLGLILSDPSQYPNAMRDYLDPEKVDVVPNSFVDVLHSNPTATFGYAPLNHRWRINQARAGGKFQRQIGDPFNEDRQRIWAVEKVDPALTSDFYVVGDLPNTIFADTVSDPFEIVTIAGCQIVGLTQFGKGLVENTADYAEILQDVDTGRITQA